MDNKFLEGFENIFKTQAIIWQKCLEFSTSSFEANTKFIVNDLKELNNFFVNNVAKLQRQLFEGQVKLHEYYKLKISNHDLAEIYPAKNKDNRFKDLAWQENIFFNYIKQSYFLMQDVINKTLDESVHPESYKSRLKFTVNFLFNAFSPSNFLFTNPEIIKKTIETSGANLIQGYANFIRDLSASGKYLNIQNIDPASFEIGKNLGVTAGKVVYKNDLFELIEYYPVNAKEYEIPMLIVPPCINKYYILDLQEKNSFVLWLLNQGHKVYLISWNNPDLGSNFSFDAYISDGIIKALNFIKKASDVKSVNLLGYCIGGTLSLCAAAFLRKKGEESLNSVTLLTALADFTEVGDISHFINENTIDSICNYTKQNGGFNGEDMSLIFNSLKPSETIWQSYINSYLLGKDLGSFDILFWNADSTRLPTSMHEKYLTELYINNKFVKEGINIDGILVNIDDLKEEFYIVATLEDHIVPWKSIYKTLKRLTNYNQVEFTLTDSGHVAGIINSPAAGKYCYWKNPDTNLSEGEWLKGAVKKPGSWWDDLNSWLANTSGNKILASPSKSIPIAKAPGSYVLKK
jgi:polyhydroxyalkanoate synthase